LTPIILNPLGPELTREEEEQLFLLIDSTGGNDYQGEINQDTAFDGQA